MIVVSDASPIINLSIIGELELLRRLFETVVIPKAVYDEICIKGKDQPGDKEVRQSQWIRVEPCENQELADKLSLILDKGEAEAIALAIQLSSDLLLIDEKMGKRVAQQYHLDTVGLLGVLLEAKQRGLLGSVTDVMSRLRKEANFRIGDDLFDEVRRNRLTEYIYLLRAPQHTKALLPLISYPEKGDFLIDVFHTQYLFEIGRKNKGFAQLSATENAFVAADDLEIGFGRKIQLWLFGFLY